MFRRQLFHGGFGWLSIVPLLFQLPFTLLLATQPTMAAINLSLLPAVCAYLHPARPTRACLTSALAKVALRSVALPLAVVWVVELRARKVFLAAEGLAAGGGERRPGVREPPPPGRQPADRRQHLRRRRLPVA